VNRRAARSSALCLAALAALAESLAGGEADAAKRFPAEVVAKLPHGTVTAADFRGLRKLREAVGARFTDGVVLYDGEMSAPFGEGLYAVPIRALWETP